eukprot:g1839.t1
MFVILPLILYLSLYKYVNGEERYPSGCSITSGRSCDAALTSCKLGATTQKEFCDCHVKSLQCFSRIKDPESGRYWCVDLDAPYAQAFCDIRKMRCSLYCDDATAKTSCNVCRRGTGTTDENGNSGDPGTSSGGTSTNNVEKVRKQQQVWIIILTIAVVALVCGSLLTVYFFVWNGASNHGRVSHKYKRAIDEEEDDDEEEEEIMEGKSQKTNRQKKSELVKTGYNLTYSKTIGQKTKKGQSSFIQSIRSAVISPISKQNNNEGYIYDDPSDEDLKNFSSTDDEYEEGTLDGYEGNDTTQIEMTNIERNIRESAYDLEDFDDSDNDYDGGEEGENGHYNLDNFE